MNRQQYSELKSIGNSIEIIASRDLATLNALDNAVDVLTKRADVLRLHAQMLHKEIVIIKNDCEVVDPTYELADQLEKIRDRVGDMHGALKSNFERAKDLPQVQSNDALLEAYKEILNAAALLHNTLNELVWAIGEHDADFDKVAEGGPFKSAEELFAAIGI